MKFEIVALKHIANEWWSWNFNPCSGAPELMALNTIFCRDNNPLSPVPPQVNVQIAMGSL